MVCSCSGSSTANIWTFFCSLQSKCNQGFSLHPFLSLSNLGTETIVTATYSWVNWDNKMSYSLFAMYCFLSQTLAVRNTPRLLYLQCPWNESKRHRHHFISPDCYKLREGKHTYMPFVITATPWHIHLRCARASLPPKYPWEVLQMCHIPCNHLLKHFWNIRTMLSHLTYMFTSLLHRDIRLVFSLTDLQVLINWHTLYSQSPQMSPGNWPVLAAQLSVAQIVSALVHISHEMVAVQETTIWVGFGEHHTSILYFFEFSLQRKWLDLQLLHMICSWTHGLSSKRPTTLPGTFCSCSYFTYHLEF